MVFFNQVRKNILLFTTFGLWSSWPTKRCILIFLLRANSAYAVLSELSIFFYVLVSYNIFDKSFSDLVASWLYLIITMTHLVIVIESFLKVPLESQIIQKFTSVHNLFNTKLRVMIPHVKENREIFIRNFIVISIFILVKGGMSAFLHHHNQLIISWYPALYSIWIMSLRSIQVVFFVHLLRGRLELVYHELNLIRNVRHASTNVDHYTTQIIYTRIKILKKIYGELFEICELINKTFGWSLLVILTQCFVDFTFNCYWLFLCLDLYEDDFGNSTSLICVSLLLPIVLLSSILTFYCSSCSKKVRKFFHTYIFLLPLFNHMYF